MRGGIGDRYVVGEVQANDWRVGGESSGEMMGLKLARAGDGIVSALSVVEAIVDSGKSLQELKGRMTKFPQKMINVRCHKAVVNTEEVKAAVAKTEKKLAGKGRVLLRPSGTEPVVRVMVEGEDAHMVDNLARDLAVVVENAVA